MIKTANLGDEELKIEIDAKILKIVEKGQNEIIVVYETTFKGKRYIGVRIFWHNPEKDEYYPSKRGLNLLPETWEEIKEVL